MRPAELEAITRYIYEIGNLKLSVRQGWWQAGVREPESIADHSFRVAVIGFVLAVLDGEADPATTATTCLFHDIIETRLGDIPNVAKHYLSPQAPEVVAADQMSGVPEGITSRVLSLVNDYVAQESREAMLAKDADRLECIVQAREYQLQGYKNVDPWIASNLAKLKSAAARSLADAAQSLPPDEWWKTFGRGSTSDEVAGPHRPRSDH